MALTKPQYSPSQFQGQQIQTIGGNVNAGAGGSMGAGTTSGPNYGAGAQGYPTPDKTTPEGYKWDPVKAQYIRTPASIATDMSSMMGLINGFGGGASGSSSAGGGFGGGGGMPANIPAAPANPYGMGGGGAPGVPHVGPVNTEAAQSAAFGRAKDQVGLETSGALTGLRSALGGRGMGNSGGMNRGAASIINKGQGELGNTSRELAIQNAGLREREGALNYGGDITQRGQTIGEQQSNANRAQGAVEAARAGDISQRGQNISLQIAQQNQLAENARAQAAQRQSMLQGLLSSFGGRAY